MAEKIKRDIDRLFLVWKMKISSILAKYIANIFLTINPAVSRKIERNKKGGQKEIEPFLSLYSSSRFASLKRYVFLHGEKWILTHNI